MFGVYHRTDRTLKPAAVLLVMLLAAGAPSAASGYTFDGTDVTSWCGVEPGEGVSETLLVVDWQIPDQDSLVLGYRWSGEAVGAEMLNDIAQAEPRFHVQWHPYTTGVLYALGWDTDGDGFDPADGDDYYRKGWDYYEGGYWSYYSSADGEAWTYGGAGAFNRDLSDGGWDGWSWAAGFAASPPDNIPQAETDVPGDSNADGVVDELDFNNLIAQFGTASGEQSADFNGDGAVNLKDFAILRANFNTGVSAAPHAGPPALVPEPTMTAMLLIGAAGMLARRSRRRIIRTH